MMRDAGPDRASLDGARAGESIPAAAPIGRPLPVAARRSTPSWAPLPPASSPNWDGMTPLNLCRARFNSLRLRGLAPLTRNRTARRFLIQEQLTRIVSACGVKGLCRIRAASPPRDGWQPQWIPTEIQVVRRTQAAEAAWDSFAYLAKAPTHPPRSGCQGYPALPSRPTLSTRAGNSAAWRTPAAPGLDSGVVSRKRSARDSTTR